MSKPNILIFFAIVPLVACATGLDSETPAESIGTDRQPIGGDLCGDPGLVNAALNRPTRTSSIYNDGTRDLVPPLAVDGNTSGSHPWAHLNDHVEDAARLPWFEVDLGRIYEPVRIDFYNRTDIDCGAPDCRDRMNDFFVSGWSGTYDAALDNINVNQLLADGWPDTATYLGASGLDFVLHSTIDRAPKLLFPYGLGATQHVRLFSDGENGNYLQVAELVVCVRCGGEGDPVCADGSCDDGLIAGADGHCGPPPPPTCGEDSVTLDLPAGFSLVANPLLAADQRVGALLDGVPDGTSVYKWNGTGFVVNDLAFGYWLGPEMTLEPGEGFFVNLPAPTQLTFTGVPVNADAADLTLRQGYGMYGLTVPIAGTPTELGMPIEHLDTLFMWRGRTYHSAVYIETIDAWFPEEPVLTVGEGFWIKKRADAVWPGQHECPAVGICGLGHQRACAFESCADGLLANDDGFCEHELCAGGPYTLTVPLTRDQRNEVVNPYVSEENTVPVLLADAPDGTTVIKQNASYPYYTNNAFTGGVWTYPEMQMFAGEAFFVYTPEDFEVTFTGFPPTGEAAITTLDYRRVGITSPVGGLVATDLGFPLRPGITTLGKWTPTGFTFWTYVDTGPFQWWVPHEPSFEPGEAFFLNSESPIVWHNPLTCL